MRKLKSADAPAAAAFLREQQSLFSGVHFIELYLQNDGQREAYGYFCGDKIIGIIGIYFLKDLPWASVPFLFTSSGAGQNARMTGLLCLVDRCFESIEERNCNRVFIANEFKKRRGYQNSKLFPLSERITRLKKYVFVTESIVKAGELPEQKLFLGMMGGRASSVDLAFSSASKKELDET